VNFLNWNAAFKYRRCAVSVADPHHFDADPDLAPASHFDADPDPTFQFDADADPDPSFQIEW
jgi:hypothetical protein